MTKPTTLRETVASSLAMRGAVIVDVVVNPGEIPAMPPTQLSQVLKFGAGKIRELLHG